MLRKIRCVLSFRPTQWYRTRIKLPLVYFIHETVNLYKQRTKRGVNNVKDILFRASIIAFVVSTLVGLSVFMYVAFYYVYVPSVSHERPVHLQFEACKYGKGMCSFPSAHVSLTRRHQLLMFGQPYKIQLDLEMPESPANKELGMFMVCADFRSIDGTLVTHSCRSAMLHYKSYLLYLMNMVIFSPLFLFGTFEEKQQVSIELFSDYHEDEFQNMPVTDVYIEIQSMYIELYSAKFLIHARFSGVRYIMFNWPLISAAIGILSNLFVIAVLSLASWYQLINSDEYLNYKSGKAALESMQETENDDVSSMEDSSSLEELRRGPGMRKRLLSAERVETLT